MTGEEEGRKDERIVVVTGFGPFSGFHENPSTVVVDQLAVMGLGEHLRINTAIMPVAYDEVVETVHRLWDTYRPHLMVHIGVHPCPGLIKVEQQSFGRGYCTPDIRGYLDVVYNTLEDPGCVPRDNMCPSDRDCPGLTIRQGHIDCTKLAETVDAQLSSKCLRVIVSDDPGRYLCAFSYFLSLSRDPKRSLFIHIPPIDSSVSYDQLIEAVRLVIFECVKLIPEIE